MGNFTEELSEFLVRISYDDLPADLIKMARNAMIDSHAAILSGYGEDVSDLSYQWVSEQSGASHSTILGYNLKTTVSLAAFMHGIMGHSIDYDDVFPPLRGHPSLLVYSAVLSVAEFENISGRNMLLAFSVGTEVMSKIGMSLNPSHYLKGWHSTSTLGVIGASVAVGKLYNFNKEQFKTLLGLVSSFMSGVRKNFGTMTKSLHVGNASRIGVESVQMVRMGMTASHDTFDNPGGVFELYSDEQLDMNLGSTFGKPWSMIEPGYHIKKYPCCYATHRFIDATENALFNHKIEIKKIKKIECIGSKGSFAPLLKTLPKTGLEAKFSVEYAVAATLIDGKISIKSFTDLNVNRENIIEIMEKVEMIEDEGIEENRGKGINGYVKMNIHFTDGVIEEKVINGKGSAKNPLSDAEIKEKFLDCASKANVCQDIKDLYNILYNMEDMRTARDLFVNLKNY